MIQQTIRMVRDENGFLVRAEVSTGTEATRRLEVTHSGTRPNPWLKLTFYEPDGSNIVMLGGFDPKDASVFIECKSIAHELDLKWRVSFPELVKENQRFELLQGNIDGNVNGKDFSGMAEFSSSKPGVSIHPAFWLPDNLGEGWRPLQPMFLEAGPGGMCGGDSEEEPSFGGFESGSGGGGGSHGSSGAAGASGAGGRSGGSIWPSGAGRFVCNGVAGGLSAAAGMRNNFWGFVISGVITAIGCLCPAN